MKRNDGKRAGIKLRKQEILSEKGIIQNIKIHSFITKIP
jgi:hypothetical protein